MRENRNKRVNLVIREIGRKTNYDKLQLRSLTGENNRCCSNNEPLTFKMHNEKHSVEEAVVFAEPAF